MNLKFTALLTTTLALTAPSARAEPPKADGTFRSELAALAKDLHAFLKTTAKKDAVAVGQFTGPPTKAASAGPGLAEVLTDELTKLGLRVDRTADIGVKGTYSFMSVDDPEAGGRLKVFAVVVKVEVVDDLGNVLVGIDFKRTILGEADVIQTIGYPVAIPTDLRTRQQRDAVVREAIKHPKTEVGGSEKTEIGAGKDYAIQILVGGKAQAVTVDGGLAYVPLPRGTVYTVRLINKTKLDAAVRLTIDGLSVFTFSKIRHTDGEKKGQPLYNVYLVEKENYLDVDGWHITNDPKGMEAFVIAELAKSAAAGLKSQADVGTITASFAAAWTGEKPDDEPPTFKNGGGDGTGRGKPVGEGFKEEVRKVGAVRASVSVRYNTKAK